MKIQFLNLHPYDMKLTTGQTRFGNLLELVDQKGSSHWGDIAPLPHWSKETLEESVAQFRKKKIELLETNWELEDLLAEIRDKELLPSLCFALESCLLSSLSPIKLIPVPTSALFMGTVDEIREQARLRLSEGYISAKLKVGNLSFMDASILIHELKDKISLRIDVNRAWEREASLDFFSQFSVDDFDYVEEPFKNPLELDAFTHPLAVDESYPNHLSLKDLEELPTLKAVVYKPTLQGGLTQLLPLYEWAKITEISIILSSSFESIVGLTNITSLAQRLKLPDPMGTGTIHFVKNQ